MPNAQQIEALLAGLLDAVGNPLAGGKVYTYEAGTTTNKATWTDALKVTEATNPIILDATGRANVYADGNYKFRIDTSADVTVWTLDNLNYNVPSTTIATVQSKSADYTALITDDYVLVNASSGAVVISLPAAATGVGKEIMVKKVDATTNTVTLDPNNLETIDGASSRVLTTQYQETTIVSDGSNWVSKTATLDQDDMSSDSAFFAPTQQSVKAFVLSGTYTMTNKTMTDPKIAAGIFPEMLIDPTVAANQIALYAKEKNSFAELCTRDESSGTVNQFTSRGGAIAGPVLAQRVLFNQLFS